MDGRTRVLSVGAFLQGLVLLTMMASGSPLPLRESGNYARDLLKPWHSSHESPDVLRGEVTTSAIDAARWATQCW